MEALAATELARATIARGILTQTMKLYACMDALLDEMEVFVREHYGLDSAGWRSGDFAAGALLEFKGHVDGRLDHWTAGDVREFLLGWFPRTVYADEDLRSDVPDCAVVFFRFLAARGTLAGDPLSQLEAACEGLRDQFLHNCRDPRGWDPAKVRLSLIVAARPRAEQDDADTPRHPSTGEPQRRSSSASRAARTEASARAGRSTSRSTPWSRARPAR